VTELRESSGSEGRFDPELHGQDWTMFANMVEPLRTRLERCVGLLTGDLDEAQSIVQETLRARAMRGRNLLRGTLGSVVDTWMRSSDT